MPSPVKDRHLRAVTALSEKVMTRYELQHHCRFSAATMREVMTTLAAHELIVPAELRNEGIRLTQKGQELAAAQVLLGLTLSH